MTARNFTTFALHNKTADKLDTIIKKSNGLYQNRAHIIRLALNDFFKKHEEK